MKKILFISLLLIAVVSISFSDDENNPSKGYLEAQIGLMNPWDTGLGFDGGIVAGLRLDQVVSLNADIGYYRASFVTTVNQTNTSGAIIATGLASQTTANLYLLFVNVRIDIPYVIADIIQPYAQLGVGYDLMYNTYQTTSGSQTDLFAGDFLAFRIEIGAQLTLGEKTYLFLNLGYMFSTVEKSSNPSDTLEIGELIDASGFSVLCGVGFKLQ